MARPAGIKRDQAARVIVDAIALGDKPAAELHGISQRTVKRYRQRLATDTELQKLVNRLAAEAERDWHFIRARFLRDVTEHLRGLCLRAKQDQISDIREALKDIGELDIAREALVVGQRDPQQGAAAAGHANGADRVDAGEGTEANGGGAAGESARNGEGEGGSVT